MKSFIAVLVLCVPMLGLAQDSLALLKMAEEKAYTPKSKGLVDMVVDVVSPQVTKELNDQMIFGNLKEVTFRIYWTLNPERVAIEVLGLPEGFREIKEELKARNISHIEAIIPIPLEKKFKGYQFSLDTSKNKTIKATDKAGIQVIPEFELSLDQENNLISILAKKAIGTQQTSIVWQKSAWSEPRSHVISTKTTSSDGPQTTEIVTTTNWQTLAGIGLPSTVKTQLKQKIKNQESGRPAEFSSETVVYYKNYKINQSEAMKWFLGNSGTN